MLEQNMKLLVEHKKRQKIRFMIFHKELIVSIKLENVSYFQIIESQLFLITINGEKYPLKKSIRDLEETLEPDSFYKINRSEIISFESIDKIETFFGQRVVVSLKPFGKVIVSKSRLAGFMNWLDL